MPSFDLVSQVDHSDLKNTLEMAKKIIKGRFDFKGSESTFEEKEDSIILRSDSEMRIKAMLEIFRSQMVKRKIGMNSVEAQEIEPSGKMMYKQTLLVKNGIDKENGKLINKLIKNSGLKIQSSYLDQKVRITGKKIDDLQKIMGILREHKDVKLDLQMENIKR